MLGFTVKLLLVLFNGCFVFSMRLSRDELFSTKPNHHQKAVLQNTFKALMGFKHLPKDSDALRPLSKTANAGGRYMRHLFQQFQRNTADNIDGNLVRSFTPTVGATSDLLLFDLKTITPSSERLLRAELHYNLRRKHKRGAKRRRFGASDVTATWVVPSDDDVGGLPRSLPNMVTTPSWRSWDAKKAVLSTIASSSANLGRHQLAVRFGRTKGKRNRKLDAAKVLRRNTPFLLVYSEASTAMSKQQVMNAVFADETDETFGDTFDSDSHDTSASLEDDDNEDDNSITSTGRRARRHLLTRSMRRSNIYSYAKAPKTSSVSAAPPPDTQAAIDRQTQLHLHAFQAQGPEILHSRREMRRRRKFRERQRQKMRQHGRRSDALPFPDGYSAFGSRRMAKQDVSLTRNQTTDANPPTYYTAAGGKTKGAQVEVYLLGEHKPLAQMNCAKRRLNVQFRDVGWEHWVIAPKTFEAHFCAGDCPFPLQPEVNPSNHAIIQSIVQTIGLNPYVPKVCCAPDRMDSLTLLYFDEDDNVVLKNYPKMIVKSCGCL